MASSSTHLSTDDDDPKEGCEGEDDRPTASTQYTTEGPIAEELLTTSKRLIQILMNDKDFSHPILNCLTPDFISDHEGGPGTRTRDEFIQHRMLMARVLPETRQELVNCSVEVNEHNGRAKVWLTITTSGTACGLEREWVVVLYWRRRKATGWMCWKRSGLITGGSAV